MPPARGDGCAPSSEAAMAREHVKAMSSALNLRSNGRIQPHLECVNAAAELVFCCYHDLRSRRRRRGPNVRDEIRDREINLVTDGGYHRLRRGDDRAGQHLLVERLKIF